MLSIKDMEEQNEQKAEIIENIEARMEVKEKLLEQREAMVEAEQEIKLPLNLGPDDIDCQFIRGAYFKGQWLKAIICKAFRSHAKVRGLVTKQIREDIHEQTQRMPNIAILEENRTNNAFFLDSEEFVIYVIPGGLRIKIWF